MKQRIAFKDLGITSTPWLREPKTYLTDSAKEALEDYWSKSASGQLKKKEIKNI